MSRDIIVGTVAVIAVALGSLGLASQPPSTTTLIIEMSGGFAYIPEGPTNLHIAYLGRVFVPPDTDTNHDTVIDAKDQPVCDVTPIGTEMMVIRGQIVESLPTTPSNHSYNLDGARVTFPGMPAANITATRTAGTPSNVTSPVSWADLRFVPSLKEYHAGSSNIIGGWRSKVNGFITVRGGKIEASVPTDPLVESSYFEFKKDNVVQGTSAVTDKVIYTVTVPGGEILINFTGSFYTKVRIKPPASGGPVKLRLRGLHAMNTPPSFVNGDEVKDFCAFYSLFKGSSSSSNTNPTPVPSSGRLKMFYVNSTPRDAAGGQPSPGFFCDGVWF